MKKLFLSLILLIGGSCLFAMPINWYLSGSYSFGTYTMKTEGDRVDMLSNGGLVSLKVIPDGKIIGGFVDIGYYSPFAYVETNDGSKYKIDTEDFDMKMIFFAAGGFEYLEKINDTLTISLGFGVDVHVMGFLYNIVGETIESLGLVLAPELMFKLNDNLYIDIGSRVSFDFLPLMYEITNGYNSSSYTGKYSLLSSKANIGLTWNINSK